MLTQRLGERLAKLGGRRAALPRPERQRSYHRLLEGARKEVEPLPVLRHRVDEAAQPHRLLCGPHSRRFSEEHLVQHAGQAVHVGALVQVAHPCRLLGAHVTGRAQRHTGASEVGAARRRDCLRYAEVGYERVALGEQDVLRLYVAVQHAAPVRVGERIGYACGDGHRTARFEYPLPVEQSAQRLAVDVRHHVVEEIARLTGVVQRHYVRMGEPRGDLDLLEEPFRADRGRELRVQHLDGHVAVVLAVVGKIDRGHSPTPEDALQGVSVRERRPECVGRVAHELEGSYD